ncbi:polysaccharide biosynthesis protein [Hoyosella rhizosphaerae]|nr:polysaccharide biosynthesis protein [Hoyosella rhizosphaerae]
MSKVTAGAMVANIAAYLLHLPASRWLGPAGYGEFAVLLAAQLLIAVPALALQMVIAREVVRATLDGTERTAELRRLGYANTVFVAAVAVLLTPVVAGTLGTSMVAAGAALLTAPALVLLATEQGFLQGQQRFGELAGVLAGVGVCRVLPAVVVLGAGGEAAGALAAGAAGAFLAAGVARLVVNRRVIVGQERAGNSHVPNVLSVVRASHVQLVIIALTSIDLMLVRAVLDESSSGLYALGAVATKVAFWLPYAVGVVLYPEMANPARTQNAVRRIVLVVGTLGAVMVVGAALAAPIIPVIVSEDYRPVVGMLWLFAAHGAVLSLLQGVLFAAVARDRTAVAGIAWVALAVEIAVLLTVPSTLREFIVCALAVSSVTAVVISAAVLWALRRPKTEQAPVS